jgi:hypothetical protein
VNNNNEAVKVNGNQVTLEVFYCIPDEESDSNRFSEIIGGRNDMTVTDAVAAVIESAKAWANGMRAEGHNIGVWDEAGNHY